MIADRAAQARLRLFSTRPLTEPAHREAERRFDSYIPERTLAPDEVIQAAGRHRPDGMIIGSNLPFDAAFLGRLSASVRVIATTGIGTDHIDLRAAGHHGIAVLNVPDVGAEETADLTLMHILMACRRAPEYAAIMRDGWGRRFGFGEMVGQSLAGRRLGIVGMGRIGQLVAERARVFSMKIHYHSRNPVRDIPARHQGDLDTMLAEVDVLTLHVPETAATRGLISAERIARLPRGAVLVNCARGGLVDEKALIAALRTGHLAAAGLDVFHNEPHPDPALLALPNVSLTPHMGSATLQARDAICLRCMDGIEASLRGEPVNNLALNKLASGAEAAPGRAAGIQA